MYLLTIFVATSFDFDYGQAVDTEDLAMKTISAMAAMIIFPSACASSISKAGRKRYPQITRCFPGELENANAETPCIS
jgi:hypothetical protein